MTKEEKEARANSQPHKKGDVVTLKKSKRQYRITDKGNWVRIK